MAAAKALELFKINAKLCNPRPGKKEADAPPLSETSAGENSGLEREMSSTDLFPLREDFSGSVKPTLLATGLESPHCFYSCLLSLCSG